MSDDFNLEENSFDINGDLPQEVKHFNWGAFLFGLSGFGGIWLLFNVNFKKLITISLISILPFLPITVYFLVKGVQGLDPKDTLFLISIACLLAILPIAFIMTIVFGVKGNEWAWRDKIWDSIEAFNAVQKKWVVGSLIFIVLINATMFILPVVAAGVITANLQKMGLGPATLAAAMGPNVQIGQKNPLLPGGLDPSTGAPLDISSDPMLNPQATDPNAGQVDLAASSGINKKDVLEEKKKVTINIGGYGRKNPFKPFYEKTMSGDFPPPDDIFKTDQTAATLMSIKISGILYDPYNPRSASAIVKIADSDYMVKKGDKISNYTIVDIKKNTVVVKAGNNTYEAGIGQVVYGEIKNSEIYNVGQKFAGNKSSSFHVNVVPYKKK
jgi:hypothetical protein